MTETKPFDFETQKRAKFNDDYLKNDSLQDADVNQQMQEEKG